MYQNVQYELHSLEKLFAKDVTCVHEPEGLFPAERKTDFIKEEAARVRQRFLRNVLAFEDESHLARYVRYHQQALVSIMDERCCTSGPHPSVDGYGILEDLLAFMERAFPEYFDRNVKAPESRIAVAGAKVAQTLRGIEIRLASLNAGPRFTGIVLSPLRNLVSDTASPCTFHDIAYAIAAQEQLLKLTATETTHADMDWCLDLLCCLNLNSKDAYIYITACIHDRISKEKSGLDKIETLHAVLRRTTRAPGRNHMVFDPAAPSLTDQVSLYLTEEISYAGQLMKHAADKTSGSPENPFRDFKLQLDLSVAQAAYLLRLLLDTGVIKNTNTAGVIRFVASHVVTRHSGNVSISSFRSKFYEVESGTKQSVKTLLDHIMRGIGKSP